MDNVPSLAVSEMILVITVVILGLLVLGFSMAYLLPQVSFANAQGQASNIARSSAISVGPLLVNENTGVGSMVMVYSNPSARGYVYVVAFLEPSYLESSIGLLAPSPSSTTSFAVYFPNGTEAEQVLIDTVYDVGGQEIYYNPGQPLIAYKVPFNTPVTIKVSGVGNNEILVVWVLYNTGYWFRVGYTFTGVVSS
mgnify:CR=1 FL=1